MQINASNLNSANHLQGHAVSSINYGLYHKDELISLMTFSASRYDKSYQYELIRYSNKVDYSVTGAASRLFAAFVKNNNPESVMTYGDRSYGINRLYSTLGMNFVAYTAPGYKYYKQGTTYSRQKFQKHKLQSMLEKYDSSQTALQNMRNNGYDRYWDAGHSKWEWINPNIRSK